MKANLTGDRKTKFCKTISTRCLDFNLFIIVPPFDTIINVAALFQLLIPCIVIAARPDENVINPLSITILYALLRYRERHCGWSRMCSHYEILTMKRGTKRRYPTYFPFLRSISDDAVSRY